jgi:hypothetical protein
MSGWTCAEAEPHLELFAAGECDPATEAALGAHLAACPACAAAVRDAEQVVGLFTLRLGEPAGLRRLQARVEAQDRRPRPVVVLFFSRAAAVAAALLVAVVLGLWPGGVRPTANTAEGVVAWASPGAKWNGSAEQRRRQVDLKAGEVWVRAEPSQEVEVRTPLGTARADRAEFLVAVAPGGVDVTVRQGKATLATPKGDLTAHAGEVLRAVPGGTPRKQVERLALRFGALYEPLGLSIVVGGPPPRPKEVKDAVNYAAAAAHFPLAVAEPRLNANGFVVFPGKHADLAAAYRSVREAGLPPFVTADAVLHVVRGQLDESLLEVEEGFLAPDLAALTQALLDDIAAHTPTDAEEVAARQLALTYLGVPLKALRPAATLPAPADARAVADTLALLSRQQRAARLPWLAYDLDLSRFRPEGHYARTAPLQGYYAAMTWYQQTPLLLIPGRVSAAAARQQTLAALQITQALDRAALSDGRPARAVWERIDAVAGFFVGLSDDLGPQQYRAARRKAGHEVNALRLQLARLDVTAAAGTVPSPRAVLARLPATAGFRLFGRRATAEQVVFDRLVYPAVGPAARDDVFTFARSADGLGIRGLPRGLDLIAAMGSHRARELLHDLGDDAYRASAAAPSYQEAFETLRKELNELDLLDSNRNLSWAWLYALRGLLAENVEPDHRYALAPYRTRCLNAALASWAQGRQDAVLYASRGQALEMLPAKAPKSVAPGGDRAARGGYVEPVRGLYNHLLALTRMTTRGLDVLSALSEPTRQRLAGLEARLQTLRTLARSEALGPPLNARDLAALASLVEDLQGSAAAGIVSVHATPDCGTVLQEATGLFDIGLFLCPDGPDRWALAAGPVLSYYELKRPATQAWTTEAWRHALTEGAGPDRPPWVGEYYHVPAAAKR